MAHLVRIQRHLEAIYAIEAGHRVDDFLIDDAALSELVAAGLVPAGIERTDEHVLVQSDDPEEVSVAVYVSDRVRQGLTVAPSLQDHCHATEGVSHFVLLLWSARQGRPLRRLDLELQAEIDKASTVLLLDHAATGGAGARDLLRRLFRATLDPSLDPAERQRYREAHRLARGYAERLVHLLDDGVHALLAELRRLYRLPAEAKRAELARAA